MNKYNFQTAASQCLELYGVELDEDTFETYAISAWDKIGNHEYKLYLLKATPEHDPSGGWYVCKPCNLDAIEAITLPFEDAQYTSSTNDYIINTTMPIEQEIEATKRMPNSLYIPGKYVKYTELGDRIYFTEPFREVNILYKGYHADENGLPYLSMREVEAIALYCAYASKYKEGILTKDTGTLQIAQLLKADWLKACDRARVPAYISQNSMNEILDALASWNRHSFGRTTKPII